jgi:murein DD-endopeptidase MepM/ murein hydrolase activator NlpD
LRAPTQKLKAVTGAIGLVFAVALGAPAAQAAGTGGAGIPVPESTPSSAPEGHYVNPLSVGAWTVSRTDMGVDLMPIRPAPVVAIGDAKILGSTGKASWPGGHFIWYRLLDGDHAGAIVYVAEHLAELAPAGTMVRAGQRIGTALPGYPWTEWGWATAAGEPRALPCYHEGMETNSGKEMARFLASLGTKPLRRLEPGPNRPSGRLC